MRKFFQFMVWPSIAGILFGVILVQFLQIRQLTHLQQEQQVVQQTPSIENKFASYSNAIEGAAPSVVSIYSTSTERVQVRPMEEIPQIFRNFVRSLPPELTRTKESLGSGVVVSSEGHILTSLHVIEGSESIEVGFDEGTFPVKAVLIGSDKETDLALLQIDASLAPPMIPIGSSDKVKVGDPALAIGYPSQMIISKRAVSDGIVSGLGLPIPGTHPIDFIQTTAAINSGNSGGALIDAEGKLIGIISFILTESGSWEGIGFAIPVNKAMFVMNSLIKYGEVISGYLGVTTGELLTENMRMSFFGSLEIQGLLIINVDEDGPAEPAGLRAGDVMVAIDTVPIISRSSAMGQISQKAPGETVQLRIYREGEYKDIDVELDQGTPTIIGSSTKAPQ